MMAQSAAADIAARPDRPLTDLRHTVAPDMTSPIIRQRLSSARAPARSSADLPLTLARRTCLGAGVAWLAVPAWVRAADESPDAQPVIVNLAVAGAQIELQFTPGFDAEQRVRAQQWVQRAADVVARYFGRFPVPQLELLLQGSDGSGVRGGVSFGEPSPLVRVRLGHDTTAEQYRDDWVLVHEMVHLAVPRVPKPQAWLHEGLATYVETVARAQAGQIGAHDVWRGWVRQMPVGQPADGDRGLDHTPTWARVYWGGAMFCLLVDVRWRRGLQAALRGVLAAGGDYRVAWPVERTLAVADATLGVDVALEQYRAWKDQPVRVDLAALWRELGVEAAMLRDDAPLAAVRRAIAG
jgi:hypothetical protein